MKHTPLVSHRSVRKTFFMSLLVIFSALSIVPSPSAIASPVIVYPVCNHKESDGADVGDHSNLCDADVFGNSKMAESLYGDVIFNRNEDVSVEKTKYVTQLYALIKSAAKQFILKKEPKASKARISRFADDIMTIAFHESRLTHYAFGKDKRFKLMAADVRLVSRGLMQINQTFHASRDRDNSLDIYGNISLGMDLIYNNEKYIDDSINKGTMSCISKQEKSQKGYEDLRLRSAWSAYNSGSAFCRFRRNDKWSGNDKLFLADMNRGGWRSFISDSNLSSKIDVACLENGDEFCALPLATQSTKDMSKVLMFNDGGSCFVDPTNGSTVCADSLRLSQCFGVVENAVKFPLQVSLNEGLSEKIIDANAKVYSDREALCSLKVPGLIKVGEFLSLKKMVALYDEIDGKRIATLNPSAQVYQVIDYTVKGQSNFERYYKIASSRGHYGYIYAGNKKNFDSYTKKESSKNSATTLSIPHVGTKLTVTIQGGLKIYSQPDTNSSSVGLLNQNTTFAAEDVQIKGSDNQIFIKISSADKEGYIYVGRTYISNTLKQYVRIE